MQLLSLCPVEWTPPLADGFTGEFFRGTVAEGVANVREWRKEFWATTRITRQCTNVFGNYINDIFGVLFANQEDPWDEHYYMITRDLAEMFMLTDTRCVEVWRTLRASMWPAMRRQIVFFLSPHHPDVWVGIQQLVMQSCTLAELRTLKECVNESLNDPAHDWVGFRGSPSISTMNHQLGPKKQRLHAVQLLQQIQHRVDLYTMRGVYTQSGLKRHIMRTHGRDVSTEIGSWLTPAIAHSQKRKQADEENSEPAAKKSRNTHGLSI